MGITVYCITIKKVDNIRTIAREGKRESLKYEFPRFFLSR